MKQIDIQIKEESVKVVNLSATELVNIIDDIIGRSIKKNLSNLSLNKLPEEDFLTMNDTSRMFKKSRSSINRWIKNGKIPPPVKIGGTLYFRKSDLLSLK